MQNVPKTANSPLLYSNIIGCSVTNLSSQNDPAIAEMARNFMGGMGGQGGAGRGQ